MMPEELDLISRIRKEIERQYKELSRAATLGTPIQGLDEGRDSTYALISYARLVGGATAYAHILDMIEVALAARDKAIKGDD